MFTSIFYRVKGPAIPSLVDNEVEFCQLPKLCQLFTAFDRQLRKREKNTLAEIRTHELAARRLRETQPDHRGDRKREKAVVLRGVGQQVF